METVVELTILQEYKYGTQESGYMTKQLLAAFQSEVLDEAGIDYEKCWSGAPLIKGITLDEAVEIITGLMEQITATVKKIDKKLGDNRKKMEENLDKKSPKAKKATAKVEEPEEEEEEEDDEEEEAPKPKKAAAPAKKTTKKK